MLSAVPGDHLPSTSKANVLSALRCVRRQTRMSNAACMLVSFYQELRCRTMGSC